MYHPLKEYPRQNSLYVIEMVLSDGSVTLTEVNNHRYDKQPIVSDKDIIAFWSWHFKKLVGLKPKALQSKKEEIEQLVTVEKQIL